MSSLLPTRRSVASSPSARTEVVVDGTGSGAVLSAIASETAQRILDALRDDPKPVSEVAAAADTSLQNARYHVERLREADIVEAVDTWYSEKGREMTVYGLRTAELVIRFES